AIPEFREILIYFSYTSEEKIINALKNKITTITNVLDIIISGLQTFDYSESIKSFTPIIQIESLSELFLKFPNVEVIHILGYIPIMKTINNRQWFSYGP